MSKGKKSAQQQKPVRIKYTMEATSYVRGTFDEFQEQVAKYKYLTSQLLTLEAQIDLNEKTLCLHRDHLQDTINNTEGAVPHDWEKVFQGVRFVGVRLADACKAVLQEKKKVTNDELLEELNEGMFRFRTNAPLREIHAALMKPTFAKKTSTGYQWIGTTEQQMPLRMRVLKTHIIDQTPEPAKEGTSDSAKQ